MAEISKTQKILGILIIVSAVYLVYDMNSSPGAPKKVDSKPKLRRPSSSQQQSADQSSGAVKFTGSSRTTVSLKKDSSFAFNWGEDPFDKSHLVEELPDIDPETGDKIVEPEIVELDNYTLSAISYRGNEAAVLINKEVLKLGDTIDGMRIEQILSNTVILTKDGKKYIIKLKSA